MSKVILQSLTFSFCLILLSPASAQFSGTPLSINSEHMGEQRAFKVYLPESYHHHPQAKYPVLYLIDGDYNAHYVTGLLSHLSSMSEKIPELIVVSIGDKGKDQYRKNVAPTNPEKPDAKSNGHASKMMNFIGKELQPYVQENFRVADFKILQGHSIAGLFTMAVFEEQPDLFDAYIAISPSMWWGEFFMTKKIEAFLQANPNLTKSLFVSLGDERGMGVFGLVDILDKNAPEGLKWQFNYFPTESHGSVGVPSIKTALLKIFADWPVNSEQFYAFKNATEVVDHYKKINDQFKMNLPIQASSLSNMIYYYNRKDLQKEIALLESELERQMPVSLPAFKCELAGIHLYVENTENAAKVYQECIDAFPNYFEAYRGLAMIKFDQKAYKQAHALINTSMKLAKEQFTPQWKMNELEGNLAKIKSMMK